MMLRTVFAAALACAALARPAAAEEKKDAKPLEGAWAQKQGAAELKVEFTGKDGLTISANHGDKVVSITCTYTAGKDGVVKAKVSEVEDGGFGLKDKLPAGTQFSFTWAVKDGAGVLSDVTGDNVPAVLTNHLPGTYEKK